MSYRSLIVVACFLTGCAGSFDAQLAATPPELQRDLRFCMDQGNIVRASFGALAFTSHADKDAQRTFDRCMAVRGWVRPQAAGSSTIELMMADRGH